MGQKLVTNRNITVAGTSGNSINFEKGKPVHVPDQFLEDCLKAGAIPVDGVELNIHKETAVVKDAPMGIERKQRILDAIDTLVTLNTRGTFNANGTPKQKPLEETTGFVIDTREAETLWHEYDAARKQGNQVDASEVITITDNMPVITGEGVAGDAGLGEVASEGTEALAEEAKAENSEPETKIYAVSDKTAAVKNENVLSRTGMMGELSKANKKVAGNISNVKLKELYDELAKGK